MALESSRRVATKRNGSRFNLPTFLPKSSSFDCAPDPDCDSPVFAAPRLTSPLRQHQPVITEEEDEDSCWLPELAEPEEVKLFKSQEVMLAKGDHMMEERGKERSRSFDVLDLLSSPRHKLAEQPPGRLSLTYGPGELSQALQALMSLQSDGDADSSEGEDCGKKAKERRSTKKALGERSQPRRSLLSLLRRRAASDKSTH
jgi:hypothetical protein